MSYRLGVDLGTTWTAAAILRDGRTSMVELSNRSTAIPSVVLLREDDSMLVGDPADRRAAAEPSRVAREFKRRIGDATPLLLNGTPYSAEALTARLLAWVVDEVARREGGPAERLVLTHPANWGEYKLDLLRQAVKLADIDQPVDLITEPEAAVVHYASQERVEPGTVIGVYDLGGGTFDAAVLRKTGDGFEFLGHPEGIERLGGIDFDEAVFQRVVASIGVDLGQLDDDDPVLEAALTRLRADCVVAKEMLSSDSDTSIPVMLPAVQTEVRLTRAELESMIRPTLADTITVAKRAIDSTGLGVGAIDRILLAGGSSRLPVVSELLAAAFGRPLALDAHPKHAVALGAAIAAGSVEARPTEVAATPAAPVEAAPVEVAATPAAPVDAAANEATATAVVEELQPVAPATTLSTPTPPAPAPPPAPPEFGLGPGAGSAAPGSGPGRGRGPVVLAGAAVVAVLAVLAIVVLGQDGDGGDVTAAGDPTGGVTASTAGSTTAPTDVATTAPTTQPTTLRTTTTTEPPTSAPEDGFYEGVRCEAVTDLCIDIAEVSLQDGELLIAWEANFSPNVDGGNHAHFFWSTFSPVDAGAGGSGNWEVSDAQPHLAGTYGSAVLAANRPAGADICVTVANPDHTVRDPAIYQCWEHPGS